MNVTSVPLNSYGMFSKTLSTTGLTPALYFVYIQSLGPNGEFEVDIENVGIYSGKVINTRTNATVFNITGIGSVKDSAASKALSDAIADQGFDDAYTKLTFQLTATGNTTATMLTISTTTGKFYRTHCYNYGTVSALHGNYRAGTGHRWISRGQVHEKTKLKFL